MINAARHRAAPPQLSGGLFLTDGGIETTLIFHDGLELPDFAAFALLRTPEGPDALRKYFRTYGNLARRRAAGLLLETPTWRASADWGARLGYTPAMLADANREAVELVEEIRIEYDTPATPVVVSGCVGPRGDGYVPGTAMSVDEAEAYHRPQIETFATSSADVVSALTLNYLDEAIGITRAARAAGMPLVVSFTVETDGKLPTGQTLQTAIEATDAATGGYPVYYMVNCAHPSHFEHVLEAGGWADRIRGVRANASRRSHAELNDAPDLDAGDPIEFGADYARLKRRLPALNVMGGCCGTDHRHVDRIAEACAPLFGAPVA